MLFRKLCESRDLVTHEWVQEKKLKHVDYEGQLGIGWSCGRNTLHDFCVLLFILPLACLLASLWFLCDIYWWFAWVCCNLPCMCNDVSLCLPLPSPLSVPLFCSAAGLLESLPTLCVLVFSPNASLINTIYSQYILSASLPLSVTTLAHVQIIYFTACLPAKIFTNSCDFG